MDLRKNNRQIDDMAARVPSTGPVAADRAISSQSVHPS
jgi:hypothetical protein